MTPAVPLVDLELSRRPARQRIGTEQCQQLTSKFAAKGNMRRRLEEIGGRCELQTEPGRGTRLSFHVHLKPSHEPT